MAVVELRSTTPEHLQGERVGVAIILGSRSAYRKQQEYNCQQAFHPCSVHRIFSTVELIVFDLDGTLLDKRSEISPYTRETLDLLAERGIAYTVATGRTLHASQDLLKGLGFILPQVYKNGVVIWEPRQATYSYRYLLTELEIRHVMEAFIEQRVSPFIFTLERGDFHAVYHAALYSQAERNLAKAIAKERGLPVLPLAELPGDAGITNISALGPPAAIRKVSSMIDDEPTLVAYMGTALEDNALLWVDIHHSDGSKGAAVDQLRNDLAASRVICFGDSDNDLSMFGRADEAYAPANAKEAVRKAATAVIGHHDEDGIARFLRERFDL